MINALKPYLIHYKILIVLLLINHLYFNYYYKTTSMEIVIKKIDLLFRAYI